MRHPVVAVASEKKMQMESKLNGCNYSFFLLFFSLLIVTPSSVRDGRGSRTHGKSGGAGKNEDS